MGYEVQQRFELQADAFALGAVRRCLVAMPRARERRMYRLFSRYRILLQCFPAAFYRISAHPFALQVVGLRYLHEVLFFLPGFIFPFPRHPSREPISQTFYR